MKGIALIFWNAGIRLTYDGGLANAGNVALSLLLAIFPFMVLIATFLDIWGEPQLFEQILIIMFENWPAGSAGPIAEQVKTVLGQASGELFTIGNGIALILATNGIESARDGLNRAYRFVESRNFVLRRLQGCAFICVAAMALILAATLLVATPVLWQFLVSKISWLAEFSFIVSFLKFAAAVLLLFGAIYAFHFFLPDGRQKFNDIIWGILLTIIGIVFGSQIFAYYLTNFANYASLYAGLAGVMIVIVYLYYMSIVILYGAEFNAALREFKVTKSPS